MSDFFELFFFRRAYPCYPVLPLADERAPTPELSEEEDVGLMDEDMESGSEDSELKSDLKGVYQGVPIGEYEMDPKPYRSVFATLKVNGGILRRVGTVDKTKTEIQTSLYDKSQRFINRTG